MQVDASLPPTTPSFAFPSSFDDFFNMDLVSSQSAPSSASSPASSPRSPPGAPSFPLTPPQQPLLSSFAYDGGIAGGGGMGMGMGMDGNGEYLSMFLDDDFAKPLAPPSASPYDFLGAFTGLANSEGTLSPQDAFLSGMSNPADSPQFAIDPSLVDSPAPAESVAGSSSSSGSNTKDNNKDRDRDSFAHLDDDDDEDNNDHEEDDEPERIAPVKVGGKGRARKGTVASGGIAKKASAAERERDMKELRESLVSSGSGGAKIEDRESDDWRPSPEEYKKMSSKEKRQLRNKISARNFRVRRKEYISTLEADISERDALISAIRSELGSSQNENTALKQEIAALKRGLLHNRGPAAPAAPTAPTTSPLSPTLPCTSPAAFTAALSPAATAASAPAGIATPPRSPLLAPNTQKDLPSSAAGARPFWGGAAGAIGMGGVGGMGSMGSYTPVHTTFVPPLAALARRTENLNPNLNASAGVPAMMERGLERMQGLERMEGRAGVERTPSPPIAEPSMFVQAPAPPKPLAHATTNATTNAHGNGNAGMAGMGGLGAFDAFADTNPFTLKTLDAYRMQLWGKMAAQGHLYQQQQQFAQMHQHQPHQSPQQQSQQQQQQLTQQQQMQQQQQMLQQQLNAQAQAQQQQQVSGLAQAMRPAFFRDAGLAGMLAGKSAASSATSPSSLSISSSAAAAYPSPPGTPKLSARTPAAAERESMQRDAMYAALASQTLLGKLGNAFWDAFSGSSSSSLPSSSSSASSSSSPFASSSAGKQWDAEKVRKVLEGKAVVRVVDVEQPAPKAMASAGASASASVGAKADAKPAACPTDCLTKVLEESMRGLTLAGKSAK